MVCLSYRFVPIFFSVLSVGCSVFNEESSRERGREMGGQAELAGYPSIREDYGTAPRLNRDGAPMFPRTLT